MIDTKTLVNDALLRELSIETRKIGSKVLVKPSPEQGEFMTDIVDVIIAPETSFYRAKFMEYYRLYSYNAVKALKELGNNFPFIPDFRLGIAYVLSIEPDHRDPSTINPVRFKHELEFQAPGAQHKTIEQEDLH